MKNIWEKTKEFLSKIWNGLTTVGRIILGLIIIALIILIALLTAKDTDDSKVEDSNKGPEVSQVYEPSIGTPLPPDNPGAVDGVSTSRPSEPSTSDQTKENLVAPKSGIDPNEPVAYTNDTLSFTATLPAQTIVKEDANEIVFVSKADSLQYLVSVNNSNDTLLNIESQLRNSPTASNLSYTTFNNIKAIKFTAKGYGSGIVFVANGQVYYLLGNANLFSTFKLM